MEFIRDGIILISLYTERFSKYVLPRALSGFVGFLIFSSNIDLFARFIINGFAPIVGTNYSIAYAISVVTLYSIGWVCYGFIINAFEALGFRNRREISSYERSNLPIFYDKNEKRDQAIANNELVARKASAQSLYRRGDPLIAFQSARIRLQEHIFRLQNNAIINLFTAMVVAIVGILVLGSAFFEIEKYHDADHVSFKLYDFLVIAVVPRLSISLFLQVFSYFFLVMYRSNLTDVRYFQNEITNIDYHAAGVSIAMRNDNSQPQKATIIKLLSAERNRLMSKNQKIISSSDDEKIVGELLEIKRKLGAMDRYTQERS